MTDLEINRRLALAIGWRVDQLLVTPAGLCVVLFDNGQLRRTKFFDHRDPAVIWPIAERYRSFPFAMRSGGWWAWVPGGNGFSGKRADTAAEAVACAVIGAHE